MDSLEGLSQEEIAGLATMGKALRDNPKTRMSFLRLAKVANPELSIPEVEAEDRRIAEARKLDERFKNIEDQGATSAAQTAALALYEDLREEGVVSKRGDFNDLVKYAAEKGFQTTAAGLRMAATYRDQEQRAAEPTPTFLSPSVPVELNKEIMKNPAQWARQNAANAIKELQSKAARK